MQKSLEVVLSPLLLPLVDLTGKTVVVIDILRATSTICAALNNGAKSLKPVVSTEEALSYNKNEYCIAGERNGEKAPGFDFGNSPREYSRELIGGKKIVLTTTNGTKCIHASLDADEVLIGSFFNLDAIITYLRNSSNDAVLFCSGWKDRVNLEDTLFAGYVAEGLRETHHWDSDEVEISLNLYNKASIDPISFLRNASHAKRFERLGNTQDLEVCLEFNAHPIVVKYADGELVGI